jgi:hypothetical protein
MYFEMKKGKQSFIEINGGIPKIKFIWQMGVLCKKGQLNI